MPQFNLDNYEKVEDRIKLFWSLYPNGRIHTTHLSSVDDFGKCLHRAELYKEFADIKPFATGHAFEIKGEGNMTNKHSHVENCETSAIGRALANASISKDNMPRPSREEMTKVQVAEDQEEPFPVEDLMTECKEIASRLSGAWLEMWEEYKASHPDYKENLEESLKQLKLVRAEQTRELLNS